MRCVDGCEGVMCVGGFVSGGWVWVFTVCICLYLYIIYVYNTIQPNTT